MLADFVILFDPKKPLDITIIQSVLKAGIGNKVYSLLSWKMIPYSRPKLSDFYTLSPTKLLVELIHRDECRGRGEVPERPVEPRTAAEWNA